MKRIAAALIALLGVTGCGAKPTPADAAKPTVYILTSLPLIFDEGFGLNPAHGPAAVYLRANYRLEAVDLPNEVPKRAVLLAAQPRALPAEELVALDAWVRQGGKLLLLADPKLDWHSKRGLGDPVRPPIQYADTGLLGHWGLRLDSPDATFFDTYGIRRSIDVGKFHVADADPGSLHRAGPGNCAIEAAGAIARCPIGSGQVTIIADADFMDVGDGEIAPGKADNLPFLSAELDRLLMAN